MTRLPTEAKHLIVESLLERQEAEGTIPSAILAAAATKLGVSARTIYRWLEKGSSERAARPGYELSDAELEAFFECNGNVAAMHRKLVASRSDPPSVRTLYRSLRAMLSNAERAYARLGEEGWRKFSLYLKVEAPCRNAMWQADHCCLPILVVPPRFKRGLHPWLTTFLDCYSRGIMGWALSLQPTSAEVLAALRKSILVDDDAGPFGGVPSTILWDNGAEFLADAVTDACAAVGAFAAPTDAYAPHQKGKVERLFHTIEKELLCELPFYTNGPRAANGDIFGPSTGPLAFSEFVERFDAWVWRYNNERVHSSTSVTPQACFASDLEPLRLIPEEKLRWMLMAGELREVRREGIRFGNHDFFAVELQNLVGEQVEVKFIPHDYRRIWVFRGSEFICEAVPHESLTEADRRAFLNDRRRARRRTKAIRATVSRKRRALRLAPVTEPGAIVVLDDVTGPTPPGASASSIDSGGSAAPGSGVERRQPRRESRQPGTDALALLGISAMNQAVPGSKAREGDSG